jgi:hypothetical protein
MALPKKYECINSHLGRIRSEKTLVELLRAWHSCRDLLLEHLDLLVNYPKVCSLAPYGASDSLYWNQAPPAIINNVLREKTLSCSGQSALEARALKMAFSNLEVRRIYVINNSINHAFVFVSNRSGEVLLDPTTSIEAVAPF